MRIGLVVGPGFHVVDLAPISVFETANTVLSERVYDFRLLSETGGIIRLSCGVETLTEPLGASAFDTIVATASRETMSVAADSMDQPTSSASLTIPARPRTRVVSATPGVCAFLRQAASTTRRVASICVGAFALAEAGLLDGRRATTHWLFASELQARFPAVRVEPERIFVNDGSVWTSAGATAGIDLALALVENDVGADVARVVARTLVLQQRRAGGQLQRSALLELDAKTDRVQDALSFARRNLRERLSVERLADAARLSPRQFRRVFRGETGQTPAKAIEMLRLEAAKLMLEQGRLPVEVIARESGFGDGSRMRRAFLRTFGRTPRHLRDTSTPETAI